MTTTTKPLEEHVNKKKKKSLNEEDHTKHDMILTNHEWLDWLFKFLKNPEISMQQKRTLQNKQKTLHKQKSKDKQETEIMFVIHEALISLICRVHTNPYRKD